MGGGKGALISENKSLTLGTGNDQILCVSDTQRDSPNVMCMNERQYALTVSVDVANTLTGTDYKGTQLVFDCRGNGDGNTASTLTGELLSRVPPLP